MQLPAGLVVLSREGCHLCEELLAELADLERQGRIPVATILDVDSDPALARQYGLKVPVVMFDGSVICHYTLNSQELLRLVPPPAAILPR